MRRALALLLALLLTGGAADADDAFRRPDNPVAPSFAFNPTTPEKAALGRRLFFDPRLSAADDMSCTMCHIERYGWTDRRRFSGNAAGRPMPRRTQTLLGVGFQSRFGWDGGIDVLEGFALAPIARAHEMAQDLDELVRELNRAGDYADGMRAAFGAAPVTITGVSHALAAFMRTLVPPETPFDRWRAGDAGAISESAKAGFRLFTGKAGCAACHNGWRFTDDSFHDIGLAATEDLGRGEHVPDDPAMRYAFKTPTLRGVAARPPYMHDGSLVTLEAAVEHYVSGIRERPSLSPALGRADLSDREKLNVVDFLMSLGVDIP